MFLAYLLILSDARDIGTNLPIKSGILAIESGREIRWRRTRNRRRQRVNRRRQNVSDGIGDFKNVNSKTWESIGRVPV